MLACVLGRELANLAEVRTMSERSGGKVLQPVVLAALQGNGLVRQRSLSAESLFGYFCGDIRRTPLEYLKKTNNNTKNVTRPSRGGTAPCKPESCYQGQSMPSTI